MIYLTPGLNVLATDASEQYYRNTAAGCLFEGLAPLAASNANQPALLQHLAQARPLPPPSLPQGTHNIPAAPASAAPVGQPVEKDRVRLQVGFAAISARGCAGDLFAGGCQGAELHPLQNLQAAFSQCLGSKHFFMLLCAICGFCI